MPYHASIEPHFAPEAGETFRPGDEVYDTTTNMQGTYCYRIIKSGDALIRWKGGAVGHARFERIRNLYGDAPD